MSTKRNKGTKEGFELFRKATEAMRLFGENPDAAGGFIDAIKKGNLSEARAYSTPPWTGSANKIAPQLIAIEFLLTREIDKRSVSW